MPLFIFNKDTRLFAIMILASSIYPIDDRTLIVRDDLCMEYQLVFDNHQQLHDTMIMLYKQRVSYVYCDYCVIDRNRKQNEMRELEYDNTIDDLEIEL